MDTFIREDGRALRVVRGFRNAALSYRAPVTPVAAWTAEQFADAAEKKRRRFGRLLADARHWRGSIEGAEILDVGCGDGTNCILAALEPVRSVVGIDLNPPLLDPSQSVARRLAETVLRQAGHQGGLEALSAARPIRLERADARATPFPDGSFDLLISRSAMEHLMPVEAALAEMARVVRPGGLVHHSIDPFYWLRGCHKRGVTDIPWAHARLSLDEFHRFVAEYESREDAARRLTRLESLNRLTARQWRSVIEAGPLDVLHWDEQRSGYAEDALAEHPDVTDTLLPGVSRSDLVCGRIDVWLRRRPA